MIEIPRITYQEKEYAMEDINRIFEIMDVGDASEELITIRTKQILQHSKRDLIIRIFNNLYSLIGEVDNEYNRTLIEQYNKELIELHPPLYFDLPLYQEYHANPKWYEWKDWELWELYDQYINLCMEKGWEDFYTLKDRDNFKIYEVIDMLNDLLVHGNIIGYDARSFGYFHDILSDKPNPNDILKDMPDDAIISVKILREKPIEEKQITEAQNLDTLKDILKVNHMSNNDKNTHFRFGKFRQRMCDLLWEQGCYDISLCDEVNAKRIFNQAHKICNKLLEDYDIVEKTEDK